MTQRDTTRAAGRAPKMIRALLLAGCASAALVSFRAEARPVRFDIVTQDLAAALSQFALQSGREILFAPGVLAAHRAAEIKGEFEPEIALSNLLRGSGLTFRQANGTFLIVQENSPLPKQTGAGLAPATATAPGVSGGIDGRGTEEIIVTASKRGEQLLQKVPMSIAALSGQKLQDMGADSFIDWSRSVPGLAVQDQGPGDKKYIIRGVQSVGAATAGVYFDEIVVTANNRQDGGGRQPDIKLFDIERVEVLRGPQGTLYGAGSMSGTIRIVTKKPNAEKFEGEVDGTVSNTAHGGENYRVNAMLNVPVVKEKFALRGVAYLRDEAGFIDNPLLAQKGINDEDTKGGRLIGRLLASDKLTLTATGLYQKTTSNGRYGYEPSVGDLQFSSYTKIPWEDRIQSFNVTAEQNLGFGNLLLTSSWFDRRIDYNSDATLIIRDLLKRPAEQVRSLLAQPQNRSIWSNEARFSSNWSGPLSLVGGVFYQSEKNKFTSTVESATALGEPDRSAGRIVYLSRKVGAELKNYSVFGELSYALDEQWSATVGARWFQFKIREDSSLLVSCCAGNTPGPGPGPVTKSKDSDVNYKFNLSYQATKDVLFYAQAAQGFRSGGNNEPGIGADSCLQLRTFGSDSLWNYELGGKASLWDGRATVNVTPYVIQWSGTQVRNYDIPCNFRYITNAGTARVTGLEAEFALRPANGLLLTAGFNYSDAKLTSDQPDAGAGSVRGLKGDEIPGQPRFTANLAAQYSFPLPGMPFSGQVRGDWFHVGSSTTAFHPTDPLYRRSPSYSLVNTRVSLLGDDWTVALFANNLFDKRAEVTRLTSAQRSDIVTTNRPREIGINLSRKF